MEFPHSKLILTDSFFSWEFHYIFIRKNLFEKISALRLESAYFLETQLGDQVFSIIPTVFLAPNLHYHNLVTKVPVFLPPAGHQQTEATVTVLLCEECEK